MRIILNGGGGKEQILDSVKLFITLTEKNKKIMYIPLAWNHGNPADCIGWFTELVSDFNIPREDIVLITDANQITKEILHQTGGIFIGGGNTYKLLKMLKDTNAFENLKEYMENEGLIMGGSAGALIFGKDIDTCLDDGLKIKSCCDTNEVGLQDTTGFDILNGYSILPHYKKLPEQNENTKKRVQKLINNGYKLICLPEETSAYIHDGKMDFIGNGAEIINELEDIKSL